MIRQSSTSSDSAQIRACWSTWRKILKILLILSAVCLWNFIAKSQSQHFKSRKESLKEGEGILVLDYAFVVQDAAQSFHWNNAQATIHPFVFYYLDPYTRSVKHQSYACISDHMTHDTTAVYTFLSELINNFIKLSFPALIKRRIN